MGIAHWDLICSSGRSTLKPLFTREYASLNGMNSPGIRIDKWLWATRLFKTRPLAAEACQGDHIKIDGRNVKPSRLVRPGDVVQIRRPDIVRTVTVRELVGKRVSAKDVNLYLEDLTPPAEYERQKLFWRDAPAKRERGSGRPTKKERRETDRFFGFG